MSPLWIGHRGLRNEYPENTVPAVRAAARHVDCVEIDVRRCGSGELVVLHDDSVERVADGTCVVSETDLETLQTFPVQGSDDPIPSFREALEAWPAGTGINVDIKGDDPTVVEEAVEALQETRIDAPHIVSVDRDTLEEINSNEIDAPIGLSFWRDDREHIRLADDHGCAYVHVYHQLCLESDVVERAHRAGLAVDAWSVDERGMATRLADAGVDAVTVDSLAAIGDW